MYSIENDKLDKAFNSVLSMINMSKNDISDLYHFVKDKFQKIESEIHLLQVEISELIDRVEKLDQDYHSSKALIIHAQKNSTSYAEKDIYSLYVDSEKVLQQLNAEKENEHRLIQRRNLLKSEYNDALLLLKKSEALIHSMDIAAGVLTGNMDEICWCNSDEKDTQIMGLRIIKAQEAERYRIARDLHDGPAQSLSMLMCEAEICLKLIDKDVECTKNELKRLKMLIGRAIEDTRGLIFNLRPISLCEMGLIPTLENYIDKVEYRNDFSIELRICNNKIREELIPHNISSSIFRMIQEALNNIQKHSRADEVIIDLMLNESTLDIKIQDNGVGFSINEVGEDYKENKGFGLSMMKERVDLLLGKISIVSDANEGTIIDISLPYKNTFLTNKLM